MVEINWNLFKAKFNGKERSTFEDLSYQLFCIENNNAIGVFRFKNQTGLETEPIQKDNTWIGFQAKYYETKVSDNKDDIIDSIRKAKRENSQLDKILFYLNHEFSESSIQGKKDPSYKTEIEDEAIKLNVSIDWRVPSHFERQLASPGNQHLAEYFFSNERNISDFIDGLKIHTENLFIPIQTDILFKEQTIKIDRTEIIQKLTNNLRNSKPLILSGEGGCGKTAIVKELYQQSKISTVPFYIFKAVEFNIQEIKTLFRNYGDYSLPEFIKVHEKEAQKIVVIDSAERISDLENQEPFKEFLSALLNSSWTIIFTTRLSYLDDLRFQLLSVNRLSFEHIGINNIPLEELQNLAKQYSFELPLNDKMKSIIQNPFYLDEYLRNYESYGNSVQYAQFKSVIWSRKIQNASFTKGNIHLQREKCFLNISKIRSEHDSFFVIPTNCSDESLSLLQKDDIIGYDQNSGGYFITHDIYEEWALEIIIDRAFNTSSVYSNFLTEIGISLIVRRAFRKWLSDKLYENIDSVKPFIEETFKNNTIELFWKDEILTSILLSDYAEEFFSQFKEKILADDFTILKKISFLLRISCKAVDDSITKILNSSDDTNLNYVFTKPKGLGWNSTIKLIYEQIDSIPLSFLTHIIPLLADCCNNNKRGETTRMSGLIGLKFYKDIQIDEEYRYSSDLEKQLIQIIIQSAFEIKEELMKLFDEVIANWSIRNDQPHHKLCKNLVGSKVENVTIIAALPDYVLKFAELFWLDSGIREDYYSGHEIEQYYGLNRYNVDRYFPASAYQTPIYRLLQFSFSNTVDFIINFTNKTISNYAESGFDENVHEIELTITPNQIQKQYISDGIWNMYRGTGSPVTPYLLQSIHMAFEKRLLHMAKDEDSKVIESWLIYIIKQSESASLTAIVASIIAAYPDKFFNVAKILFSCNKLFLYDTVRASIGESQAKSLCNIGLGLSSRNESHEKERLKSCEDKHRNLSLESIIVYYQFFRRESTNEEEADQRRKDIEEIIDNFYTKLPNNQEETDDDKTTRLLLARIDRRKMDPKIQTQGDNMIIDFNPQIDPDLEIHRNEAVREANNKTKYIALKLWATNKFDSSKAVGDYSQYDQNAQLVLKETKEIIEELNNNTNEFFYLFNYSIPAFACSALIQEYSSELSLEDKEFCAEVIIQSVARLFAQGYDYQISDGVEASVNALPFLIEIFEESKDEYLLILLLILFDLTPIGNYKRVCDYSIESVASNRISLDNLYKILIGYIKFKPAINLITEEIKSTSIKQFGWPRYLQCEIVENFVSDYKSDVETLMSTPPQLDELDVSKCSLEELEVILQLIPYDTTDKYLLETALKILPIFAQKLLIDDRKINYSLRHKIFVRISYFILFREVKDISQYINPFVENFAVSKEMASFLQEFISAEDRVVKYEQFWIIWELFYDKICANSSSPKHHFSDVMHNYLLAWPYWKETASSWHSLKDREKIFYKKVIANLGHLPCVLDAVAQFLNQIGSIFLDEGILGISDMVEKNKGKELETNTVYYIERLVRKYIYLNRTKVRRDIKIKIGVLVILNFLIEHSSVNAYLLREDIL